MEDVPIEQDRGVGHARSCDPTQDPCVQQEVGVLHGGEERRIAWQVVGRQEPRAQHPRCDRREEKRGKRAGEKSDRDGGSTDADKDADKKANGNGTNGNGGADTTSAADKDGDKQEALEIVLDVVESLFKDRDGNLWGSMVKQVLKRKRPQFSESYYGYRSFNQLLEDARDQELLEIQKDQKSGGYVIVSFGPKA